MVQIVQLHNTLSLKFIQGLKNLRENNKSVEQHKDFVKHYTYFVHE